MFWRIITSLMYVWGKKLFIGICSILSCYILIMYNIFQLLFAHFIVLCPRPLQKLICIPVLVSDSVFCSVSHSFLFFYRPRMFFVSLAIFHLSVSCPFIVYDLVKLWSAAALVTDRPPAPTQTNRTYYYQSIYIRYEGLFCLLLFKCSPIADTVSRCTRSR